jgi:hypothetical protein
MAALEQRVFACHAAPTRAPHPITSPVYFTLPFTRKKAGNPSFQITHHSFKRLKPADLPMETADFLETLDRKTPPATGLTVSDDLPRRAEEITRQTSAIAAESEGGRRLQKPGREERDVR